VHTTVYVPAATPSSDAVPVAPASTCTSTPVPVTVNVWASRPVFVSVSAAPAVACTQVGSNEKSLSSTVVVAVGLSHAGGDAAPELQPGSARAASSTRDTSACLYIGRMLPGERGPVRFRGPWATIPSRMSYPAEIQPPVSLVAHVSPSEAARIVARAATVDAVGLEDRAASLAKRSIKKAAKLWGLDLAIRCMDLTTLEGSDTTGKIVAMCAKAIHPDPVDASIPAVAAVCVYPHLVSTALAQVERSSVKVASVAGAFPSGLGPLDARLREIRDVAAIGAHEIDIVLNRSLFLGGRYAEAFQELLAAREAAGEAHLKVILEAGDLGSYDRIRQASMLAMAAGADFIKTSTGKIGVNATLPNALCMMEAARDFHRDTGRMVGIKVAGGIRASKQALQYLVLVHETLGPDWMTPDRFRIGASSLLNDVLMQIDKERTGRYQGPDYFTID
jgi:deoxyribose-phosphate aldolase